MDDQQIDRALTSALRRAKGPAAGDVDVRDCIDAERLAAWSAGALSADDAAGVERHLATCVRCQEIAVVFADTVEPAAAAAPPAAVQTPVSKILRRWMAPLAAAAAVVVWLAWPSPSPPGVPADTMARVEAPPPRAETPPPPASPAMSPAIEPSPSALAAPSTQGGAAAAKLGQSARDGAAADQMKAVERMDRSRLQEQQPAAPKPAPPERAQPSTPPPPPATAPVTVPAPTAPPVLPPAATAPVMAAPPPPPAPPPTAAREFRAPAMAESLDPRSVVAQFSSAMPPAPGGAGAVAGGARGGGGRGGGGGANRQVMADAISVTPAAAPYWRVLASGTVERSTDGGVTWSPVLIDPPAHITSGAAPLPTNCWLIGRGGVVLISTNGQPFVRVTPPTAADLASIRATSARDATVTTTDGRSFRTTDGGVTWVPV